MKKLTIMFFVVFSINAMAQTLKDCSTCSTQTIQTDQIKDLSIDEIRLLTNEIFARNGYVFENGRFQYYFEGKSWYKSKNDNKKVTFNNVEEQNIKLFQEKTKQLKSEQEELVKQLKQFKALVISDNKAELKSKFNFFYENPKDDFEPEYLKEVLKKIDFDDVNYYKNKGLHSLMTDNGFVKIVNELSIEGNNVTFSYNYMAMSEIIEDFNEFTDYHSESEFSYNWQFQFKNNKLKFIRLAIAG